MKYLIVIEKTESGYSAHCPDIPDCVSTGADLYEISRKMCEAIDSHLDSLDSPIPKPRYETDYIEVREVAFAAPNKGVSASGRLVSKGGIVVYKGSNAVGDGDLANSVPPSYIEYRQSLIAAGSLSSDKSGGYEFASDVPFRTLSQAASIIAGYNKSGYDDSSWHELQKSN